LVAAARYDEEDGPNLRLMMHHLLLVLLKNLAEEREQFSKQFVKQLPHLQCPPSELERNPQPPVPA